MCGKLNEKDYFVENYMVQALLKDTNIITIPMQNLRIQQDTLVSASKPKNGEVVVVEP